MDRIVSLLITFIITSSVSAQSVSTYFPKRTEVVKDLPAKKKVWIFLLAGQSNMAGRGLVEAQDTIPNRRILTINRGNEIVIAKEPLHYYEPTRTGLDCGLSFANTLLKSVPKRVSILLVPVAVGGSSIQQWLGDSTWRDVKLLTNAKEKIAAAKKVGVFKGVLWHQGEANANSDADIEQHVVQLRALADTLRKSTGVKHLPFMVAELGSFSTKPEMFNRMNQQLKIFAMSDKNAALIDTSDLTHLGDKLHFDAASQRKMGERFAAVYVGKFLSR